MFEAKIEGLQKLLAVVNPDVHKKAASRAINETLRWAQKEWIKGIREKYAIKATYLRKQIFDIHHASPSNLTGKVVVRDKKQFTLGTTNPYNPYPISQNSIGIKTEFIRGKPFIIPHAFIRNGKAWRRKRIGGKLVPRKPIEILKGPGTPVIARNREITDRILKEAVNKAIARYEALILYYSRR
jgi:hypothetical protein